METLTWFIIDVANIQLYMQEKLQLLLLLLLLLLILFRIFIILNWPTLNSPMRLSALRENES